MIRRRLEKHFGSVWVQGEISDVTRRSGHVYFTLNDEREQAQLRCVMFRSDAQRTKASLEVGAAVRLRGSLTIYQPRGTFQLMAKVALPAGFGDLHQQFERTRRKLAAEGLFSEERKRPLPRVPQTIGVVTSAQGAALHDVVRVARQRCPVRMVIADCRVQGPDAPLSIIEALLGLQRLPRLDAIIIARGGGSAEDLAAFNQESVARTIAEATVPIVTGIGHETDTTIADFVADRRASTPSNAAEVLVPERAGLITEIDTLERRLYRGLETKLGQHRLHLERLGRRLGDPRHRLRDHRSEVGELHTSLERTATRHLSSLRSELRGLQDRLGQQDARRRLRERREAALTLTRRLEKIGASLLGPRRRALEPLLVALPARMHAHLQRERAALSQLSARLSAMSPLEVLGRGYAIALKDGSALTDAGEARPGDSLELVLHKGRLPVKVTGDE